MKGPHGNSQDGAGARDAGRGDGLKALDDLVFSYKLALRALARTNRTLDRLERDIMACESRSAQAPRIKTEALQRGLEIRQGWTMAHPVYRLIHELAEKAGLYRLPPL